MQSKDDWISAVSGFETLRNFQIRLNPASSHPATLSPDVLFHLFQSLLSVVCRSNRKLLICQEYFQQQYVGHHIIYDRGLGRIYFHVHLCIIFFPLSILYLFKNDTFPNIQSCGASLPPARLQVASQFAFNQHVGVFVVSDHRAATVYINFEYWEPVSSMTFSASSEMENSQGLQIYRTDKLIFRIHHPHHSFYQVTPYWNYEFGAWAVNRNILVPQYLNHR